MDLNVLQQRLLGAARKAAPTEHVPYAFEKRIMARLGTLCPEGARVDEMAAVIRAFCCGAVASVAIAMIVGAWGLGPDPETSSPGFTDDLEQSILASAGESDPLW